MSGDPLVEEEGVAELEADSDAVLIDINERGGGSLRSADGRIDT
jgi:hypothetical protein